MNYFKSTFPNAPAPSFVEWAENSNIDVGFLHQVLNTGQATSGQAPSATQETSNTANGHEEDEGENATEAGKKVIRRETWSQKQTNALVVAWKENFESIETFKQSSAWLKVKVAVDKEGPHKTVKQIKAKLVGLKKNYKEAKDNNSRTGAAPQSCNYYEDFDEMLSKRDTISLKYVKEIGCKKDANITPENEPASPTTSTEDSLNECSINENQSDVNSPLSEDNEMEEMVAEAEKRKAQNSKGRRKPPTSVQDELLAFQKEQFEYQKRRVFSKNVCGSVRRAA